MKIIPKNWRDFQHYKDRNPPWIRLHKKLIDNFDYQRLPLASKALAPMLWLLASESVDGCIDADPERLAFRLRMQISDVVDGLKPLIDKGFFELEQGACGALAESLRDAVPETETETETETEAFQKQKPPLAPEGVCRGFAEFWAFWPKSDRKGGKAECEKLWKSKHLEEDAETIIAHVRAMAASEGWRKEGGKFIPAPLVYLRGKRWDGAEIAIPGAEFDAEQARRDATTAEAARRLFGTQQGEVFDA